MKTKTITLYSFDELSKEAQEKAHQEWIESNDYYFLSECTDEWLHELLVENKVTDLNDTSKPGTKPTKVMYSLSNSQGDGAMFEGEFHWKKYTIYIKHSGHYYHSNSKTIEIHETDNLDIDIGDDYEPKVYAEFESIYQSICKTLEQKGYDFIDYENSLESFKEACEANEYTFLSTGKMEN